jgi:Zn-dependent protease
MRSVVEAQSTAPARCARCGGALVPSLLACPSCGALVHAARLKEIATAAVERTQAGDLGGALGAWRTALELLPEGTRQHSEVSARIAALSDAVTAAPTRSTTTAAPDATRRAWLGRGAAGAALLGLLSKGKLLLLGLTKLSTLGSMLLAFGLYLTLWSWKFALGFIVAIYVHEMGHVFALRRYGIAATPPMFVPGVGAFVRLKQHAATVAEDARVGLAGPIWGFAAALVFFIIGFAGGGAIWTAIAQAAGLLNLFNLTPLVPLDGGRAFNALSRPQRLLMVAALGAAWWLSQNGLVGLVLIVAFVRVLEQRAPAKADWTVGVEYLVLVGTLTWLAALPVPTKP